jgi:alpha-acetolactate decarboxylase
MNNTQKQKKIQEIFSKYKAKMLQIQKAKIKILNELRDNQSQADLDKIRKKMKAL